MFPDVIVAFEILSPNGAISHYGTYRLNDDMERRAFGRRCHEAIADGYEVRTWRRDYRPEPQTN